MISLKIIFKHDSISYIKTNLKLKFQPIWSDNNRNLYLMRHVRLLLDYFNVCYKKATRIVYLHSNCPFSHFYRSKFHDRKIYSNCLICSSGKIERTLKKYIYFIYLSSLILRVFENIIFLQFFKAFEKI